MARIKCDELIQDYPCEEKFKSTIKDLSERDYPGKNYFKRDAAALDPDLMEHCGKSCYPDMTVDAVIGNCEYDVQKSRNSHYNRELVMIELKIDEQRPARDNFDAWIKKVSHTRDMLVKDVKIHPYCYVILNEGCCLRVRRNLTNLVKGGDKYLSCIQVMAPDECCNTLMLEEKDFPYRVRHDLKGFKERLLDCNRVEGIYEILHGWRLDIESEINSAGYHPVEVKEMRAVALESYDMLDWSRVENVDAIDLQLCKMEVESIQALANSIDA